MQFGQVRLFYLSILIGFQCLFDLPLCVQFVSLFIFGERSGVAPGQGQDEHQERSRYE